MEDETSAPCWGITLKVVGLFAAALVISSLFGLV